MSGLNTYQRLKILFRRVGSGCFFQTFWGPGSEFTLDSSRDVQVVTQFLTSDGTDTGELVEVRRKWVQGRRIHH